jgi:lipopolysaccharide export system protein LptA
LPASGSPELEALRSAVAANPEAQSALERAQVDPATRRQVEAMVADPEARAALEKAVSDPQARAAISKATEALLGTMEKSPASAEGVASAVAAAADGLKAGGGDVLGTLPGVEVGGARDLVRMLPKVAAALPQVSQALQPGATAPSAVPSAPKSPDPGMRVLPDGSTVPAPTDLLPNRIPRPQLDPSTPPTRITAESSSFDTTSNVVTFEGNVELDHPEFDMTCDILVAELHSAAADAAGKPGESGLGRQGTVSGIRTATASGYVVIEKLTPEGRQVAKSRKTVYDAATGIVTLSDFPVLDDGKNLVRGREAWTKILLSPDGKYKVDGPATFELVTPDNQLKPGRPRQGGTAAVPAGGTATPPGN